MNYLGGADKCMLRVFNLSIQQVSLLFRYLINVTVLNLLHLIRKHKPFNIDLVACVSQLAHRPVYMSIERNL